MFVVNIQLIESNNECKQEGKFIQDNNIHLEFADINEEWGAWTYATDLTHQIN